MKSVRRAGLQHPATIQHQLLEGRLRRLVAQLDDAQCQPLHQRVLMARELPQRHALVVDQMHHGGQHKRPPMRRCDIARHVARRVIARLLFLCAPSN